MKTAIYTARTLFDGQVIGQEGLYTAIPDMYKNNIIEVHFDNEIMTIKNWHNADGYRKFDDKFGRKDEKGNTKKYTLAYFLWKPDKPEEVISAMQGLASLPEEKLEKLRKILHK